MICAATEYEGGSEAAAFSAIDEKIRANMRVVLDRAAKTGMLPRDAAVAIARARVERAMATRRWDH